MDLYQKKWVGGFVIGGVLGFIIGVLVTAHLWVIPLLEVINK